MAAPTPPIDRAPDLLVIGGGAAGLAAARAGVRRGATTLLVQQGRLGGDCTFTGCVPSKAVIEAAGRGAGFPTAMAAAHAAVETIAAGEDDAVLAGEGVPVVHGWASFRGPREVDVDGTTIRPRRVVVATGSRPAVPPVPGLDGIDHLTNETVFDLEAAPASLVVLGGGAAGCELAQALARLGVLVTVVEALPRLLAGEEHEASEVVRAVFDREGIDVRTGATVVGAEPLDGKGAARLHLGAGVAVEGDRLLVAAGRTGATDGLGLEAAGVATERGFVVTDDTLATNVGSIWAAGDVAGKTQLTHAADEMGRIAAGNALSRLRKRRFRAGRIPSVIFTAPEVAHVGLSEAKAAAHGGRVAYVPMTEVDRAVAAGQTDGFVKLMAGPRPGLGHLGGGRLIGATVVAARGGELIAEATLALRTGMFSGRLAQTVHAYPTWSTAMQQAAAQFFVEVAGRRARPARSEGEGR
jgi:pyruvate/2-oxoglutarate dehydrogenase complex dihydrolipoamide dehydrogenase (E3) component